MEDLEEIPIEDVNETSKGEEIEKEECDPVLIGLDTEFNPIPRRSIELSDTPTQMLSHHLGEKKAEELFHQWVSNLWFLPTGFIKQASVSFKKKWIPFYKYSCETKTSFQGTILIERDGNTFTEEKETITRGTFRDLFFCASCIEKIVTLTKKMGISNDIERFSQTESNFFPSEEYENHVDISEESLVRKDFLLPFIKAKEEEKAKKIMCQDFPEGTVKSFQGEDPQLVEISVSLVFFPIYEGIYEYNKNNYLFIVDAIGGKNDGERPPFGLGKLGDIHVRRFVIKLTSSRRVFTIFLKR